MYKYLKRGKMFSKDYQVFVRDEKAPISILHDIPLVNDDKKKIFNMVVEMPRWTCAKMECSQEHPLNPIRQDVHSNGKLRYLPNIFPLHGILWNYGFFPQTWSNPDGLDELIGKNGDDDPLDVIEIGCKVAHTGQVIPVKVLGALAMIDQDEADWKVVVVNTSDPLANLLNDITDLDKNYSGLMEATMKWLRCYKLPSGKPKNTFAENMPINSQRTLSIIDSMHEFWSQLALGRYKKEGLSCKNVTLKDSPFQISYEESARIVASTPEFSYGEIDPDAQDWYYFSQQQKKKTFFSETTDSAGQEPQYTAGPEPKYKSGYNSRTRI